MKLVAEGKSPNVYFKIKRGGCNVSNLSEGECSLISFCYFIAKVEDELKDNSSNLVIYIDDPISSLDSNHIFFMFSLIENVIAKPLKYHQMFISTHNLDFLRYLKQLTFPKADKKYFLIERKNETKIILRSAPDCLKEYITEFNYLFHQIYRCSNSDSQSISENYEYNFGNNMRKFLEAYLFYKYPTNTLNFAGRIRKFFHDDIAHSLIKLVVNEYSHLENCFDRSLSPIDIDEIKQISQAVMNNIKEKDKEQYDALVESINKEGIETYE